jgi:NAD(P)H-dependent FMN reductase
MTKLKVILGSTREGRQGEKVFSWMKKFLKQYKGFETEFLDLKDWPLKFYSFPVSPAYGKIDDPLVKKWTAKIADADAFVIITPEYNHSFPAVLKNALDHVYHEWNNKPVAFMSYSVGPIAGSRAVEQLRQIVIELQMAPIREQLSIPMVQDAFDSENNPTSDQLDGRASAMFKQLEWWANTLKAGRKN